jgi:hypothetical protein
MNDLIGSKIKDYPPIRTICSRSLDLIELRSKPIRQNDKRAIDGFIHKCKSYANEPANYNSRKRPFKVLNVDVKSRAGSQ